MQTIENIPKNPDHVDNVPKRPENPDCNVQKVYLKFRHVPEVFLRLLDLLLKESLIYSRSDWNEMALSAKSRA